MSDKTILSSDMQLTQQTLPIIEQIADLMHIDPSTAKRWHAKAIALLTLPEDAIFIREAEETEEEADLPPAA